MIPEEITKIIIENWIASTAWTLVIGFLSVLVLLIVFLRRELVLSSKLRKKVFLIGPSSDQAKKLKGILDESIFKYIDESGDLSAIDKIKPKECLLIGLVYFGYEAQMERVLEVARDKQLPLIVYCGNNCRLEGDFKEKLDQYRWFDMCQTPYRFVSVAFSAITANHHNSLLNSIKQIWKKKN
jgi:hypothetical protein